MSYCKISIWLLTINCGILPDHVYHIPLVNHELKLSFSSFPSLIPAIWRHLVLQSHNISLKTCCFLAMQENILHGRSLSFKSSRYIHNFVLYRQGCCAAAWLSLYPVCHVVSRVVYRHAVNGTEENKVLLNSVTYLNCLNWIVSRFSFKFRLHYFLHFENLNYASREQHYFNEFNHSAIGSDWVLK